jgi:dTDP-4-amino-4,6-dideoxygalactose transaminase
VKRPSFDIAFNRPAVVGCELDHVRESIAGGFTAAGGEFTRSCEALLQQAIGCHRAMLTTSCTDALEMAALLLNIVPGDEVILPAFTFVSTANAFALRGARLVFADIREDTLNLDEALLPGLITERTRAVVLLHYAGVACEMDAIEAITRAAGIPVVEDNAHGLFAGYRDRPLGAFGALATQSFHETKNLHCGEGGALLINDPSLEARAEILRDKGTDRQRMFRGEVDKYTWVDLGSSFALADMQAAFLLGQLEESRRIQRRRRQIWELYDSRLRDGLTEHGYRPPHVPPHCDQAYHMYAMRAPDLAARDKMISHLRRRGILAPFHYTALNRSAMARKLGVGTACPVTERASDRLLRLPFFYDLTEEQQTRVIDEVLEYLAGAAS